MSSDTWASLRRYAGRRGDRRGVPRAWTFAPLLSAETCALRCGAGSPALAGRRGSRAQASPFNRPRTLCVLIANRSDSRIPRASKHLHRGAPHARSGRRAGEEAETSASRQRQPMRCQHDGHGSPRGRTRDHWVLSAIRATTHVEGTAIGSSRRRTPTARPEQARAGPGLGGARIWANASAGTRRRLHAGSKDAGRTSPPPLARSRDATCRLPSAATPGGACDHVRGGRHRDQA